MPSPPHRLERLQSCMDNAGLNCTVVFGADNVNHLCRYRRYFGGFSGLVIERDGERTLVVMSDEVKSGRARKDECEAGVRDVLSGRECR
jgi:hypothetical protein